MDHRSEVLCGMPHAAPPDLITLPRAGTMNWRSVLVTDSAILLRRDSNSIILCASGMRLTVMVSVLVCRSISSLSIQGAIS